MAIAAERLSQIDAADIAIDHSLHRAARLRQSILKRAFEGKLVPQDPRDEPASVLLERIKQREIAQNCAVRSPRNEIRITRNGF